MHKLLLLLSSLSLTPAIAPLVQTNSNVSLKSQDYKTTNEKIDIGDIVIKDYKFDIGDETNLESIRQIAFVLAAKSSGSELAYKLMLDVLENPTSYTIMNDIDAIPGFGESITFKVIILANSTNPSYKGIINFNIVLTNQDKAAEIDLSQIKDIIENQFVQIEQPIVADEDYIISALKTVDEKLITLGVPMFGHNDLLEWGYSTNQLKVEVSNIGDITNNSGFYTLNKFEISVPKGEFNHFKEIDNIILQVGRTLKNKINMSVFNEYSLDFSTATRGKYKVHTNGQVDVKNVLAAFDQYLFEYSNNKDILDANGQLFSQEYAKKGLEVILGDSTKEGPDLIKHQFSLIPTNTSKVFSLDGGNAGFTVTFLIDDIHLIPSDSVNFYDGYEMWSAGWVYGSYDGSREYNVFKWKDYANTWEEFITKYGSGNNEQLLKFDVKGTGWTNWTGISGTKTADDTVSIALSTITTENKDKIGQKDYIKIMGNAGTSKVSANFWTGIRHDDNYIILKVTFFLEIGCFARNDVTLEGRVNNVRFTK